MTSYPHPLVFAEGKARAEARERSAIRLFGFRRRRLLLQLAEHRIDVDALIDGLRLRRWNAKHFELACRSGRRTRGGDFRRDQRLAAIVLDLWSFLGGAIDLEVE